LINIFAKRLLNSRGLLPGPPDALCDELCKRRHVRVYGDAVERGEVDGTVLNADERLRNSRPKRGVVHQPRHAPLPRIRVRDRYRKAETRTRGSGSGAGALASASRARAGHAQCVLTMCAHLCNVVVYTNDRRSKWLEHTRKT
jgi:hypothetical protein